MYDEQGERVKATTLLLSLAVTLGLCAIIAVPLLLSVARKAGQPTKPAAVAAREPRHASEHQPSRRQPTVAAEGAGTRQPDSQSAPEHAAPKRDTGPVLDLPPPVKVRELPMPGPLTLPESAPVPVPGQPLKELVPGYETRRTNGFTMLLSSQAIQEAQKENGKPFGALTLEFDELVKVLPAKALTPLRRVLIWVEWDNRDRGHRGTLAKYYGGTIWRLDGSDHPLKSNAVELLSLKALAAEKSLSVDRGRLVLLHELAHAVHHVLLGFDNPNVIFAYNQAMDRRLYDRVQNDRGGVERAYAATNAAEYFAELSCAYLDRCKSFPFTRDELKEHDPTGYRLMESVWGKAGQRQITDKP